jgi:hypothetical protein
MTGFSPASPIRRMIRSKSSAVPVESILTNPTSPGFPFDDVFLGKPHYEEGRP